MKSFRHLVDRSRASARAIAPYAAAALLVPGGPLIAASLGWYRHRKNARVQP